MYITVGLAVINGQLVLFGPDGETCQILAIPFTFQTNLFEIPTICLIYLSMFVDVFAMLPSVLVKLSEVSGCCDR